MKTAKVGNFEIGGPEFTLIGGPCVAESREICFEIASFLKDLCASRGVSYIFKASFDKANRSSGGSFRGNGMEYGLEILSEIKSELNLPVLTDIHESVQAEAVAKVVDVLQIPAFLCRQTDLLVAAAKTGKVVNIKKGQFLAPEAMSFAAGKVRDAGNPNVMLTDRGTTFGYYDLIVDMRGIPAMQNLGYPVVMDITHSLQQPNQTSGVTGGQPEMIETIARASGAAGVDGLFIETHPNPAIAKSDGANMLALDRLESLLERLARIRETINAFGK